MSDPRDRLNASFVSMMDECYASDIAQRVRDSIAHRRAKGELIGPAPFGTVRTEAGYLARSPHGFWVLPDGDLKLGQVGNPTPVAGAVWRGYADCVQRIYALYTANECGYKAITTQLVAEGWHFSSARQPQPRTFTRGDMRRIICLWSTYASLSVPGNSLYKAAPLSDNVTTLLRAAEHSVFDVELIRAVAAVQAERRNARRATGAQKKAYRYALAGLLYCPHCEARAKAEKNPMLRTRYSGSARPERRVYRHAPHCACATQHRTLHIDRVEAEVGRLIELLGASEADFAALTRLAAQTASDPLAHTPTDTPELLARLRRQLTAARDLLADGDLARDVYIQRKAQLERDIAHLEATASGNAPLDHALTAAHRVVTRLQVGWPTDEPAERQKQARAVFESISFDLHTQRITDFRLKPTWDRYLVARATFLATSNKRAESHENVTIAPSISSPQLGSDLCLGSGVKSPSPWGRAGFRG